MFSVWISFESIFHAIWSCPKVKNYWKLCDFDKMIRQDDAGDVIRMLIRLKDLLSKNDFELFLIMA